MASIELRAEPRQALTLSPRLQHAARLLQMSSLDFAATVRAELGSNPFLEVDESDASPPAESDRDVWQSDAGAPRRADAGELASMELMAVTATLADHLHGQLEVLPLPARDLLLARVIVGSLDDDGYLRTPLDELQTIAPLDPPASEQEMRIALKRVQALDPAGVAARSVGECLQLQLAALADTPQRALASRIVEEQLPLLAAHDAAGIARRLGAAADDVEQACERIRRLDPRPGWRHGPAQADYIVPDVIVRRVRGLWRVQLNPAVVPHVRFNAVYAELFARHRRGGDGEMANQLQEARWTMRTVSRRYSTIVEVAEAIVRRQRHFLEYGAMAMRPLALREIAEEVGVHESTVSRVSNNKYMATPGGVFELKHFFSRAMVSENGSASSGTAIRELVRDIIAAESGDRPLSDVEITRLLAQQGLVVARRTVTKYRQMLRIEAVGRRRR